MVDECVDTAVIAHLDALGFDVKRAPRSGRADSMNDPNLLGLAVAENRVLLTVDPTDFEPLARQYAEAGREHCGIVFGHKAWGTGQLCRAFENTLLHTPEANMRNVVHWAGASAPAGGD